MFHSSIEAIVVNLPKTVTVLSGFLNRPGSNSRARTNRVQTGPPPLPGKQAVACYDRQTPHPQAVRASEPLRVLVRVRRGWEAFRVSFSGRRGNVWLFRSARPELTFNRQAAHPRSRKDPVEMDRQPLPIRQPLY